MTVLYSCYALSIYLSVTSLYLFTHTLSLTHTHSFSLSFSLTLSSFLLLTQLRHWKFAELILSHWLKLITMILLRNSLQHDVNARVERQIVHPFFLEKERYNNRFERFPRKKIITLQFWALFWRKIIANSHQFSSEVTSNCSVKSAYNNFPLKPAGWENLETCLSFNAHRYFHDDISSMLLINLLMLIL